MRGKLAEVTVGNDRRLPLTVGRMTMGFPLFDCMIDRDNYKSVYPLCEGGSLEAFRPSPPYIAALDVDPLTVQRSRNLQYIAHHGLRPSLFSANDARADDSPPLS